MKLTISKLIAILIAILAIITSPPFNAVFNTNTLIFTLLFVGYVIVKQLEENKK